MTINLTDPFGNGIEILFEKSLVTVRRERPATDSERERDQQSSNPSHGGLVAVDTVTIWLQPTQLAVGTDIELCDADEGGRAWTCSSSLS